MLVSAIIPTYNRAATIGDAVASVLAQTYSQLEVIVVDDGSSDSTDEVLSKFGSLIRVVKQANAGPSAARNHGVAISRGEIVSFLDSDDTWRPKKIAEQVSLMNSGGSDMCCCVCNSAITGLAGEPAGNSFQLAGLNLEIERGEWLNPGEVLARRFLLFNQVVAIRRSAFDQVNGFNPNLRILEDYELAMKLTAVGRWGIINQALVDKRNDTDGIGVACMKDPLKHISKCAEVIAGIIAADNGLSASAKAQLRRSLDEIQLELRAEVARHGDSSVGKVVACGLDTLLKVKKAFSRLSPSWPQPKFIKL